MTNLAKLDFVALDISGKNYLSWALDAEIHLEAQNLGPTIKDGNSASPQNKAKAMIFLRHHLHKRLKDEYLTVKDPLELWTGLADRFAHQKTVVLPRARYEWTHLRLQDYSSVIDYNSTMFRITSQMNLCGETVTQAMMLEKTFSTFHASNMVLQQQYREKGFTKYSDLISCLLVAEQNNELLMKNHQSRPTGSQPFPEANAIFTSGYGNRRGGRHGKARNRGHRRGQGRQNDQARGGYNQQLGPRNNAKITKGNGQMIKPHKNEDSVCLRCGGKGHWARTYRAEDHLVALYKASLKKKHVETNYIDHSDPWDSSEPIDITPLDVSDFFANNGSNFDDMTSGGILDYY
ncbi:uncharacterized protein LOC112184451 [Rosa chinensis]|uniref:uncharacterized protein LOC112184451 n=1 Tax=Rosa chinensis TaxID=74649 RepID=UPI000D08AC3D|nr:uncharacterized protein LOC112184451 [Rosa chinensis]